MLKLISVLVAICAMTVNINVSAATSDRIIATETRNDVNALATSSDAASFPTFRAGDVIQFNVSDLTADTTLTLISHKYDSDLTNSTVQYINEYEIAPVEVSDPVVEEDEEIEEGEEIEEEPIAPVVISQNIEYIVRDIDDGIYKVVINGNDAKEVATFYYKVGTPKVSIVKGLEGTNYYVSEAFEKNGTTFYSVAFVGEVTLGGDVSYEDAGLESVGFEFNLKDKKSGNVLTEDFTEGQLSALLSTAAEIHGSLTIYFGVTMFRIPQEDLGKIIATPRLDGSTVLAE